MIYVRPEEKMFSQDYTDVIEKRVSFAVKRVSTKKSAIQPSKKTKSSQESEKAVAS
jgi:hypothetical protein